MTGNPWDPAIGFRVGAVTGGVLGAGLLVLVGVETFWIVIVAAAIGGAIGYWSARRDRRL